MARPGASLPPSRVLRDERASATVPRSTRFELKRCLGRGGFGSVYEAVDRKDGSIVAVKVLERAHPDAVLAFKREFRELADVQHPNLVGLRELLCEDGQWLLAMELIEGRDLWTHVHTPAQHPNSREPLDAERTRDAFRQLTLALMALHAAGKVHRDVKPSNVRVTREGRVVLLDFGLVASVRDDGDSQIAGTLTYMAPEQAVGDALSPAADFYAMGVVLFEALTGTSPYEEVGFEAMVAKQKPLRFTPRDLLPEVPEDLSELAVALLDPRAEARPRAHEILDRLTCVGHERAARDASFMSTALRTYAPELVGRKPELTALGAALARARRGSLATCFVLGESGVGKTRLIGAFSDRESLTDERLLVLRARCYENETVAYKAVDGIIDALGRALRRMPDDVCRELLPARAGLLPLVFPVLGRVPAIADMGRSTEGAFDRVSLRALVFGTLRDLLSQLARRHTLVLIIDDLQWADAESIALLSELLRPPSAPALLLVATSRPRETCPAEVLRGIDLIVAADDESRVLELSRLSHEETVELALQMMAEPNEPWADAIARESEGHPLFVEVLVRHSEAVGEARSLDVALAHYVRALDDDARRVLELCCVAGVPMPRAQLLDVADLEADAFASQLGVLRAARLLRTSRAYGEDTVEPFHDRVRAAVASAMHEDRARRVHRRIALAFEAIPSVDRERVAQHWHAAGMPERAAQAAVLAGDQANEALAFQKAARMYAWAIELEPELRQKRALVVKLAEALSNAGRISEAADLFLDASTHAAAGEGIELRRRAAELLIQSGRLDTGRSVASELLASVGLSMPRTRAESLRRIVWAMLKRKLRGTAFVRKNASEVPHGELARVDVLWSIASTIGPIDHFAGAALQMEHYLRALDAGEPGRISQAEAMDVFGQIFMGKRDGFDARLAHALTLAEESARPDVIGLVHFIDGAARGLCSDWKSSLAPLDRAEHVFSTQCTGVAWLLGTTRITQLGALFELGHWKELLERFPRALLEMQERGDPYLRAQTLLSVAFCYHLLCGRPDRARAALQESHVAHATSGAGAFQRWIGDFSVGTYENDPDSATRCLAGQKLLWDAGSVRMPNLEIGARTRVALASAMLARRTSGHERTRHVREIEVQHKHLKKSRIESGKVAALMIEAVLCDVRREPERAVLAYELAEQAARAIDRRAHADVALVRRAQLLGGDSGASLVEGVAAQLAREGVREPLRFLGAALPGVIQLG